MTPADPVVVCCPDGHQLNAERTHLGQTLACPVCGKTFRPAVAPALAMSPPTTVSIETTPGLALKIPGYTPVLLGLWIAYDLLLGLSRLLFDPSTLAPPSPGEPPTVDPAGMCMTSFLILVFPAAVVLQLLWIHRLHRDALRAGGYTAVSPELALGLSFIPIFNFIWTGWTLRKLGAFAIARLGMEDRAARAAFTATSLCFGAGILKAAMSCVSASWGAVIGFKAGLESGGNMAIDPTLFATPSFQTLMFVSSGIGIFTTLVYIVSIFKLQAVLYRALSPCGASLGTDNAD